MPRKHNPEGLPYLKPRTGGNGYTYWYIVTPGRFGTETTIECTGTQDHALAEQMLAKRLTPEAIDALNVSRSDAMTRQYFGKVLRGTKVSLAQACESYVAHLQIRGLANVSIADAYRDLEQFKRSCNGALAPISAISAKHVSDFVNPNNPNLGYARRTVRLKHLTGFLEFCANEGWMPKNVATDVRIRTAGLSHQQLVPKKSEPFTDDEIARLLKVCPKDSWWYGAILLGKHFGLRISTVACLEWKSLPDLKRIEVFTKKAGVIVNEPLPDEVADWFRGWKNVGSDFCFPWAAAKTLDLGHHTRDFSRIVERAGITGKTFKSFRVRTVTNNINAVLDQLGGNEKAVMSALIVKHGIAGVQKLVGHVAGSTVTERHYFNPQQRSA